MTSWFKTLTGFDESIYDSTKHSFVVGDGKLTSVVNNKTWNIGELTTPNLNELRKQAEPFLGNGHLKFSAISADAHDLHATCEEHSVIQVASQFNLLEMTHYEKSPEHGISCYEHDATQGPACAMAAGPATIYRNYFVPVNGQIGQTRNNQLNMLGDMLSMLRSGNMVRYINGYVLLDNNTLTALTSELIGAHGNMVRVGIHSGVEVTAIGPKTGQLVTQVFCSALPIAYNRNIDILDWHIFARMVLDSAYEATLLAGIINAAKTGNNIVYLTLLGGGAFGNPRSWIFGAISRALQLYKNTNLDVRLVCYGKIPSDIHELVSEYNDLQTVY